MRPWPAGVYIGSIRGGQYRADGHASYLWGMRSRHGWWYYFLAVGLYKVPLGIAAGDGSRAGVAVLRAAALRRVPPGARGGLLGVFSDGGGGPHRFRHFLPAYVPLLMLCTRCVLIPWRPARLLTWFGVVASGAHVLLWHPDYLSYINFPRDKPYLAISDSNVDWGQSLKQVRTWLDEHPQGDRPVSIGYFGNMENRSVRHYLGTGVRQLADDEPAPKHGLLIISPVWVAGAYGHVHFAFLRQRTPDAVIGHSMLVYDLDRLAE
jgi:hypothetical protein